MAIVAGLSIATSGLQNIERQLALIAHNVGNAETPGYVREISVQTALTAAGTGLGVRTGAAIRDIDTALQAEIWHQSAAVAGFETRQTALSAIDSALGAPGAGDDLASLLGAMRDAFSSLVNDPANQASQGQVVGAARTLAARINDLGESYMAQRQAAQDALHRDVDLLSQSLKEVGTLSENIIKLKSMGLSTADLESQRDQVVRQIAELVDVKVLGQANGDVLLVTANGLALPTRGETTPFSIGDAIAGAQAWYPGGGLPGLMLGGLDVTAQFGAGRIGANLTLRDTTMPSYLAALDEFAHTLATRLEEQGLRLFTDPAGSVPAGGVPPQSGYVGFSLIVQVSQAVSSNAWLVRDGTHAIAGGPAGASAFVPNPPGGPAGFVTLLQRVLDFAFGAQVQLGVPHPPSASINLGPAGTLSAPFAAAQDLGDIAASLVSAQAADSRGVAGQFAQGKALRDALQAKFDVRTVVNVDAEMALMVQLQNAYGANARVIAASQAMWDQLLGAVR